MQEGRWKGVPASVARRSKMSLMNEFMMLMARFEIPVSEWTCFSTLMMYRDHERTAFLLPFLAPFTRGALGALGAFPFPPVLPDLAGIVTILTRTFQSKSNCFTVADPSHVQLHTYDYFVIVKTDNSKTQSRMPKFF